MKRRFQRPGTYGHLFITVRWRRWCLGCNLFQTGRDGAFPPPRYRCSWDTPYANSHPDQRPPSWVNQERA